MDEKWPADAPRANKPSKRAPSRADLDQALAAFEPGDAAAVLALYDLLTAGKLPRCHDMTPNVGYSLVADFGEQLPEHFDLDHDPEAAAVAKQALGLGDNGGGVVFFLVPSGLVRLLDMGGMPHYWQDDAFPSIDAWWWALFHAHLVQDGRWDEQEFMKEAERLGCIPALKSCSIDIEALS